ncbi:MAG: UPF0158 family protein [Elusimicrobiales bacterium]|nr:UPF0158 family protein [Elusimicrobiales bacterium]
MKVKLSEIMDAIEMADQYSEYFLDRETGEIIWISDMAMDSEEKEEACEQLDARGFYRLPTSFDIREYDMMEEFIYSLPEPVKGRLDRAIRGKGAFVALKIQSIGSALRNSGTNTRLLSTSKKPSNGVQRTDWNTNKFSASRKVSRKFTLCSC